MNPALNGIWKHMLTVGLGALAHANYHAAFRGLHNRHWPEMSVLQAAHAAELVVKARIAQEHPLLIFERIPPASKARGDILDLEDLFESGKTIQWRELPDRLWATTGVKLPNEQAFIDFGRLRNGIQHFGLGQNVRADDETLRFVFSVVDPFINQCWGLYAVDYDEDDEYYLHFVGALVHREIPFLVSPGAAECFGDWNVDWSSVSESYAKEMHARAKQALQTENDE